MPLHHSSNGGGITIDILLLYSGTMDTTYHSVVALDGSMEARLMMTEPSSFWLEEKSDVSFFTVTSRSLSFSSWGVTLYSNLQQLGMAYQHGRLDYIYTASSKEMERCYMHVYIGLSERYCSCQLMGGHTVLKPAVGRHGLSAC